MPGMSDTARRRIVLLGVGHTHAQIVKRWGHRPLDGARLLCVSNQRYATYSGMLPGVLAGQYQPDQMAIDLPRLCQRAGVELRVVEVSDIDVRRGKLLVDNQPPIDFDVLSIGIGSQPNFAGVKVAEQAGLVPIKPMQSFLQRLNQQLQESRQRVVARPLETVIVGGGAGGLEIACCLPRLFERSGLHGNSRCTLVDSGSRLLPAFPDRAVRIVERRLRELSITCLPQRRVVRVSQDAIELSDGEIRTADAVVWATGAQGPPLLRRLDLPCDERGFLWTRPTLQVLADVPIFAVGDSGTVQAAPSPKAGVYAVRQGPLMWNNLGRLLAGRPLQPFHPQPDFLKLLNTGDGKALLVYHGWTLYARGCWWLKDAIDRRFMRMIQGDCRRP
jgi:pyridine nucleotide-disulfide oxidoreductase family protein